VFYSGSVTKRCENVFVVGLIVFSPTGLYIALTLIIFCPLGSVSVFHKYSLGGDTTVPSGLYARLCHAFLFFIYNASLQHPIQDCWYPWMLRQTYGIN